MNNKAIYWNIVSMLFLVNRNEYSQALINFDISIRLFVQSLALWLSYSLLTVWEPLSHTKTHLIEAQQHQCNFLAIAPSTCPSGATITTQWRLKNSYSRAIRAHIYTHRINWQRNYLHNYRTELFSFFSWSFEFLFLTRTRTFDRLHGHSQLFL